MASACTPEEAPPREATLTLTPVAYSALPGWQDGDQHLALAALARSCARLVTLGDDRSLGGGGVAGTVADWRPLCQALAARPPADAGTARAFIEHWLTPFAAAAGDAREGLFTGYYEASLDGARQPSATFATPLHRRPDDLVSVSLGDFRPDLEGERIAGRVVDGRLVPYADRAAIAVGALDGRGLELIWVDDPVDAFFLHIQGSGKVALNDGGSLRVGYAGQNGHPYTAVGRVLIARGEVSREDMSMQAIRAWLAANPDQAQALMNENRSYVFFAPINGDGPLGAQGVALTAGRSLAVDRRFVPLSVPVWLDSTAPDPAGIEHPLRRLLIAQDTGGAIRGPLRGDVFWGDGEAAAAIAGRMKSTGRAYLLLPHGLDAQAARR